MEVLKRLIGQKVTIYCPVDEEFFTYKGNKNLEKSILDGELCIALKAKVVNINIQDFYFYEKQEEIDLTIICKPIGKIPTAIDIEIDYQTNLKYLRYAGN